MFPVPVPAECFLRGTLGDLDFSKCQPTVRSGISDFLESSAQAGAGQGSRKHTPPKFCRPAGSTAHREQGTAEGKGEPPAACAHPALTGPGRGRGASQPSGAERRMASWCNGWPLRPGSGALPLARPPSARPGSLLRDCGPLPATQHKSKHQSQPPTHGGSFPCTPNGLAQASPTQYLQEVEDHPPEHSMEHFPAALAPWRYFRSKRTK